MYDFSARRGDGTPLERLPAPSWLLTACEAGRFSIELPASLLVDAIVPAQDEGHGRPVLVIPGFSSPDSATRRCRSHLHRSASSTRGRTAS